MTVAEPENKQTDDHNNQCLIRMIESFISVLDEISDVPNMKFLTKKKIRKTLNMLLSNSAEPLNEDALDYFDVHPLIISKKKIQTILEKCISEGPNKINYNTLMYALFMSEELQFDHAQEDRARRELIFACLPCARQLNENILALY